MYPLACQCEYNVASGSALSLSLSFFPCNQTTCNVLDTTAIRIHVILVKITRCAITDSIQRVRCGAWSHVLAVWNTDDIMLSYCKIKYDAFMRIVIYAMATGCCFSSYINASNIRRVCTITAINSRWRLDDDISNILHCTWTHVLTQYM